LLKYVCFLIIFIFILDIIFTFGLNFFLNKKSKINNVNIRIEHPIYHHTFLPNQQSVEKSIGRDTYTLITNSLGFKDFSSKNIELQNKNKRILFIGDSITEGVLLDYEDTFVGIIAKKLSANNIEVLNAARGSYSPIIYWKKTKHLIEQNGLKFDELIVFLDISDPQDEAMFYDLDKNENVVGKLDKKEYEKYFANRLASKNIIKYQGIENFKTLLHKYTTVIYNLSNLIFDLLKKYPHPAQEWEMVVDKFERYQWTTNKDIYNLYGKSGIANMKKYLNKLHLLLKKNDIELKIAVYPLPTQIWHDNLNSMQVKIWKEWSKEKKIDFINFFPILMKGIESEKEKLEVIKRNFFPGASHFNKKGNELIAEEFLKNYGI